MTWGEPRGWFAVASNVGSRPECVRAFGRDLVVYRGDDGAARVTQRYCPHLGADLGAGEVRGCRLVCPFHGWEFGGDGKLASIPYSRALPNALLRQWPVAEWEGVVFAWSGPGRLISGDGVSDPYSFAADGPAWPFELASDTDAEYTKTMRAIGDGVGPGDAARGDYMVADKITTDYGGYRFRSTLLEVGENSVDAAHVPHLHGGGNPVYLDRFSTESSSHVARVALKFDAPGHGVGSVERVPVTLKFTLRGLGIIELDTIVDAQVTVRGRTRFFVTPEDDGRVCVRIFNRLRKIEGVSDAVMYNIADMFFTAALCDFEKDVAIWSNKVLVERPILVDGDGPVREYRRWAQQFVGPLKQST